MHKCMCIYIYIYIYKGLYRAVFSCSLRGTLGSLGVQIIAHVGFVVPSQKENVFSYEWPYIARK